MKNYILDHLIAAAFSLWRAVFLSETDREMGEIYKSQKSIFDNCYQYKCNYVSR
jgi:hypothetical protein